MFNATVGGSNLNQVAPTGTLVVSDALLGKPFATKEVTLKLSFPDVTTREAYQSGKPAYLTITINNITGVLYLVKRSFSGNVKKCATVFTVSLQAPCKSQARPPKFYLHFARVWSQPPAGMRYNKAVPTEAQ